MATPNTSRERNLETFSLVWLDSSMNNTQEKIDAQKQLRASINHLRIFADEHECEEYIRSVSHLDRIILIANGRSSRNVVPRVHQLRQLSAVYVYCRDQQRNEQWTKQFPKVRGICVELDQLIAQFQSDQRRRDHNKIDESLVFNIFNSNLDHEQSINGLNEQFVHSQLLIDHLLRMEPTDADFQEFISVCKEEYKGNNSQLAIVREVEVFYSSDRSLWWYTRDSFLYRILNKALRMQNIDQLFLFRFFIGDLRQQLEQHRCLFPQTVYRGQLMSKDELQLLKQSLGELISFNSFLSTSVDRHLALDFSTTSDDLERVLFEIDADPRRPNVRAFANITLLSFFPGEEEILFMLGSIFRIVNIDCDQNGVWMVHLTLCSDQDNVLKPIIDHLNNANGQGETHLGSFGTVLYQMGKLDEAERFYCRFLDQLPSDDYDKIAACYYSLGMVVQEKGYYESSLGWFHKSLEMFTRILDEDDPVLADTHTSMATVYKDKGDHQRALESYNKALVIFKRAFGEDHLRVAMCFYNMGNVYHEQKKHSEALFHHEKALYIRMKHLPADHSELGESNNIIGTIHHDLGHSDLALEYLHLSIEIKKKSLRFQHPSIARTLTNIGLIYEDKREWKQALLYYEKAAIIFRHSLSPTHPSVDRIEHKIRRILSRIHEVVC